MTTTTHARSDKAPVSARFQVPWGAWSLRLVAVIYLGFLVAIPILVILLQGLDDGLDRFLASVTNPIALSALRLTVQSALIMTVINTIIGTLTAYVLVRYRFPFKNVFNAFIDLPFAIPTLVTGVMLVLLYGPQTDVGKFIERELGFRIIYEPSGIVIALLFVCYPFVVRAVQPVLMQLNVYQEEAAQTLGASDWQIFWRVIFPAIRPAILTGSLLSFARALGEFGSIIIVSSNISMRTEVATVYVYAQIYDENTVGAAGISFILVLIAFSTTILVDILQRRSKSYA